MRRFIYYNSSYAAGCDADALAFLSATGIVDATISSAICTLVSELKSNSLWTKMKSIFPFVGGTSTTHSYDLKTLGQGVFFGGWTHTSNGAISNGINGYFNTNVSPFSTLSQNSNSVGYYSRAVPTVAGYSGVGSPNWFILGKYFANNEYFPNATSALITTATTHTRLFLGSRTSSTSVAIYRDGSSVKSGSITSQALPSNNFWLGGINNGGSLLLPIDIEFAFFFLADGLSAAEVSTLNTIVNTFQTTLGRAV